MRFNYKIRPLQQPHPQRPKDQSIWMPLLPVSLSYGHGPQTKRIEALVDSGADDCLFHQDLCAPLGIKLEKGIASSTGGIVAGQRVPLYFHDVKLWVGADMIKITAGFGVLPIAGILGRYGFFEHFIVTFDPSANPPGFEIQRLGRA